MLDLVEVKLGSQRELDQKLAQLVVEDNWKATEGSWKLLVKMREVYKAAMVGETGKQQPRFWALDVETWEFDHSLLLEFGWSLLDFAKKEKMRDNRHIGMWLEFNSFGH